MEHKDILQFLRFIDKSSITRFELETEEFKIVISKESGIGTIPISSAPVNHESTIPASSSEASVASSQSVTPSVEKQPISEQTKEEASDNKNLYTFKSPMIGTFYRRPAPDKPPFVEVGTHVNKGDVLCIIEAMKLFNEIESDVSGTIEKILVEDGSPVEYDQPLFLIRLD